MCPPPILQKGDGHNLLYGSPSVNHNGWISRGQRLPYDQKTTVSMYHSQKYLKRCKALGPLK